MNPARSSVVKFLAAVLAAVSVCVSVLGFGTVYYATSYNGYSTGITLNSFRNRIYGERVSEDLQEVVEFCSLSLVEEDWASEQCSGYANRFAPQSSNFFFTVEDMDTREILLSNYTDEYSFSARLDTYIGPADYYDYNSVDEYYESSGQSYYSADGTEMLESADYDPSFTASGSVEPTSETAVNDGASADAGAAAEGTDTAGSKLRHVMITGYVRKNINDADAVVDDYYVLDHYAEMVYGLRYQAVAGAAGGAVLFLVLYVFLLYAAGRRKGTDEITLRFVDHIPWDVYLLLCGALALMVGLLGSWTGQFIGSTPFRGSSIAGIAVVAAGESVLFMAASVSIAARSKTPGWWKNSLVYLAWNGVGALFHHPLRQLGYFLTHLSIMWKTLLLGTVFVGLEVLSLYPFYWDGNPVFLIAVNVLFGLTLISGAVNMKRLQLAGKELADGNMEYRVDTGKLFGDYRRHGEDLNHIGDGISVAVEEKVKSERFRTELITNVSHDLKTPLTSIVNYVDLLSKLDLSEDARAYVEVLQRQSNRLKKLTEDLVEASKASTGNLKVELGPVDLGELLVQVTGEYEDRLRQAGISPVVQSPEEPIIAMGDGRYLWRIIDNLLSNVRKYALPGTRVYIDASVLDGAAVISVKNISRDRLNVSADELMRRFVRGDASRNTEGSGLGLSIAQSLAVLMHGKLSLTVDGDLFKAELSLPLAEQNPETAPENPE